jgi:hypothetical protein
MSNKTLPNKSNRDLIRYASPAKMISTSPGLIIFTGLKRRNPLPLATHITIAGLYITFAEPRWYILPTMRETARRDPRTKPPKDDK